MISPEIMRTHSQFLFNWERGKPEASLRGRRESWRVSIIHSSRREFIHSGNIGDFRRCCDKGIELRRRSGISGGAVGKERKRKERIGQWDTPSGVSHLAGKLPRCSTKSRGNLGDYAAHRSSRVRSPWISCLGAFQLSDGSFQNYRDFGVSPKIGRGPRIRPVYVASLSSFARPISLHPVWNISVIPIDPSNTLQI